MSVRTLAVWLKLELCVDKANVNQDIVLLVYTEVVSRLSVKATSLVNLAAPNSLLVRTIIVQMD